MFVSEGKPELERRQEARAREAELREAVAQLNIATARVVELVGSIDGEGSWGDHDGCLSMTHFLSWQCGVGRRDANRLVSTWRKLAELPATRAAFASGKLSLTQVEAIARMATPETDATCVRWASLLTAAQLDRLSRISRRVRRALEEEADDTHRNRYLHTRFDDDGSYLLSGRFEAEAGAIVEGALDRFHDELIASASAEDEQDPWGARRADALVQLAEAALASEADRSGADATQVMVHLTPEALVDREDAAARGDVEPGVGLTTDALRRLCCDASFLAVLEGRDGHPLNVGRKTRRIPTPLRRALEARDPHCRFPGCDRTRFRDGHHITHWSEGGPTSIDNLLSLCRRHHRLVHEGGYRVERNLDGGFEFFNPWGRRIPEAPDPPPAPGPAPPAPGVDDSTCRPAWDGSPLDDYALDLMVGELLRPAEP